MICITGEQWVCPYSAIYKDLKDIKMWSDKIEKAFLEHGEDNIKLGYTHPIGVSNNEKAKYKENF